MNLLNSRSFRFKCSLVEPIDIGPIRILPKCQGTIISLHCLRTSMSLSTNFCEQCMDAGKQVGLLYDNLASITDATSSYVSYLE
jgi:hypothetical protein